MSKSQTEQIAALQIELEETRAKLKDANTKFAVATENGALTAQDRRDYVASLVAELAASQGREAAMRAALGREVVDQSAEHTWCQMCRTEMRGVRPLAANHPHAWGCALATDGSGWVSPETVSGLVEALEEMLRLTPVGQHCVALCRPGVDEHHADCNERGWRDALAAFENSKRGGK